MAPKLTTWFARLAGRKGADQPHIVCQRFLEVFRLHGVTTPQIPRLLPWIKLADLQSDERLLAVLEPGRIDQVAKIFGVRVQWLEGVDDEVYDHLTSYKEPKVILEHINTVLANGTSKWDQPIRILTTRKELDRNSNNYQVLAPVVVEKIAELGEESIFRYHVYRDGFPWGHPPARIELKALARTFFHRLGITVPLYEISSAEMENIVDGRAVPGFLRHVCHLSSPSLEDYALATTESGVAKEIDELDEVLCYVDEHGLNSFDFVTSPADAVAEDDAGQATDTEGRSESVKANAVKAAKMKHAQTNAIKQRFVQFYGDHASEYESKSAAARTFFLSFLDEKERLAFTNIDTAQRVFVEALRKAGTAPR